MLPSGVVALVAAMSPALSKHRPLVSFSVELPLSVVGLIVMVGVGVPVIARFALANSTRVNGVLELLDQRLPEESNANSQGPCTEPLPSSLRTRVGVRS